MNLKANLDGYFELLNQGRMMDAFEKYYADDCVMQENNEAPRVGKEANRAFELEFLGSVEQVHDQQIKNVAINEDSGTVFIHAWMDATFKGGGRMEMEEVQVQTWKDDQIVHEKFFYDRSGGQ
jgi:ketosteroid isomerase-like protein